jgi:hypothetical protein
MRRSSRGVSFKPPLRALVSGVLMANVMTLSVVSWCNEQLHVVDIRYHLGSSAATSLLQQVSAARNGRLRRRVFAVLPSSQSLALRFRKKKVFGKEVRLGFAPNSSWTFGPPPHLQGSPRHSRPVFQTGMSYPPLKLAMHSTSQDDIPDASEASLITSEDSRFNNHRISQVPRLFAPLFLGYGLLFHCPLGCGHFGSGSLL